jgi:hypothetical protein
LEADSERLNLRVSELKTTSVASISFSKKASRSLIMDLEILKSKTLEKNELKSICRFLANYFKYTMHSSISISKISSSTS